jgi:hypothetical protein
MKRSGKVIPWFPWCPQQTSAPLLAERGIIHGTLPQLVTTPKYHTLSPPLNKPVCKEKRFCYNEHGTKHPTVFHEPARMAGFFVNGGPPCPYRAFHPASVYWHIAQSEGYKLVIRDYHEFVDFLVLSPEKKMTLKEYLDKVYHPVLDKLSSGSIALEKSTYETMSGAYRSNNITLLELRGNPMKHNRDGVVDLDHAIMAMLRGMERALLEYPKLRAGVIFCLDRQFPIEKNEIIVEKAIKYRSRGLWV